MEPVSLGIAAAALLASKFGEGFAEDVGQSAWNAIKRLGEVVAARLRSEPAAQAAVATMITAPTPENKMAVAAQITAAARSDASFAAQIDQLVSEARREQVVDTFVAQAFDSAKQVNIRGDNSGTINLG
ncbi:hypothetical protein [Nocardia sp. NPDC020380]|uniref:hypothetical protein n=1 Tax=Nocardia sp. NPDC020380 TaxID=3364309 RepID=UPI0037BA1A0E